MTHTIKIGGASGYWGESAMATPQLLAVEDLDYLVYDYLAEITMSIMARMKLKDPSRGYATDFIDFVMKPFLPAIAAKGVKVIANAGGTNPMACGERVREIIKDTQLDLKVAVITGDDLLADKTLIAERAPADMFSGAPFPDPSVIASINAYLGAFPIAQALSEGADIIITGRCVDSAVTLGACIHAFGWQETDYDRLASGSLAGHILECGPQATGGNFTDWTLSGNIANIGYPVAQIHPDGRFTVTKPEGTTGLVSVGTVSEQMLYEIGDPKAYILPDVVCDFSDVTLTQSGPDRVDVSPAQGRAAPPTFKTCMTYMDGFRGGTYLSMYGQDATKKAQTFANAAFERARKTMRLFNLGDFTDTSVEILGSGSQFGQVRDSNEVVMKLGVRHADMRGVGIFLKEVAGLGLATPPGLSGFTGAGRPKPSPVVRLHSFLTDKSDVKINIHLDDKALSHSASISDASEIKPVNRPVPDRLQTVKDTARVPLIKLAWGRSGDKGDSANIGIIARKPEYLPYIWAALDEDCIRKTFAHFNPGDIDIFYLPGSHSLNILMQDVLGGGGIASLRNDAQAKGYAQILLAQNITIPAQWVEDLHD